VSEAGAPDFITVNVRPGADDEPRTIIYVRQDTLPSDLRRKVGKAVVEKTLDTQIFPIDGTFGLIQRQLLAEDMSDVQG
jgi:ABC-type ATPase with predicted acetyltransferase domain